MPPLFCAGLGIDAWQAECEPRRDPHGERDPVNPDDVRLQADHDRDDEQRQLLERLVS